MRMEELQFKVEGKSGCGVVQLVDVMGKSGQVSWPAGQPAIHSE